MLTFAPFIVFSYYKHSDGAALAFAAFTALSAFLVLFSGRLIIDDDGITHRNAFGTFRMRWRDIREIEQGGQLVLKGEHCRFVVLPTGYWSGSHRAEALALLEQKLKGTGIAFRNTRTAAYKWHWNVRVR